MILNSKGISNDLNSNIYQPNILYDKKEHKLNVLSNTVNQSEQIEKKKMYISETSMLSNLSFSWNNSRSQC